jgi:putative sporulation protein YyaC
MTEDNILTFDTAYFDREVFANGLSRMVGPSRPVLFLCIGTDCSTGDSLGPLVGHQLRAMDDPRHRIIGTLRHPVTALNLPFVLEKIRQIFPRPCIIAIDAALGEADHIGQITLSKRPLQPGLGVKKSLPAVGEISITGIIGSYSFHPESLQSIRLSLVMDMAEHISAGIRTYCFESCSPHP